MLHTPFQDIFDTRYPIIQAGMGPYDTTSLAGAVARAGGLGLISTVGMGSFTLPGVGEYKYSAIFGEGPPGDLLSASIDAVLDAIQDAPAARFGINVPVSEEFIPTAGEIIRTTVDRIKGDPRLREQCTVVVTSAGDPLPWSTNPGDRARDESVAIKEELPDVTWCHVVPSVRAARRCEKAGVDVITASGREGGAHCSWRDTSSMVLIPEVIEAVDTPVVAAGGFADGRSLAAALALGAIGVQMGTRFIATRESDFEPEWKERLVHATEEDSLVARGFFGPMRFIRNRRALELVDATLSGAPDLYKGNPTGSTQEIIHLEVDGLANLFDQNLEDTPILGGTVAGRVHDIPAVADLVTTIVTDAERILRDLQGFVTA